MTFLPRLCSAALQRSTQPRRRFNSPARSSLPCGPAPDFACLFLRAPISRSASSMPPRGENFPPRKNQSSGDAQALHKRTAPFGQAFPHPAPPKKNAHRSEISFAEVRVIFSLASRSPKSEKLASVVIAVSRLRSLRRRLRRLMRLAGRLPRLTDRHLVLRRRRLIRGPTVRMRLRVRVRRCRLLRLVGATDRVRHVLTSTHRIGSRETSFRRTRRPGTVPHRHKRSGFGRQQQASYPNASAKNVPKRYPATCLNGVTPSE